jgi:hypothetical protein
MNDQLVALVRTCRPESWWSVLLLAAAAKANIDIDGAVLLNGVVDALVIGAYYVAVRAARAAVAPVRRRESMLLGIPKQPTYQPKG